VAIAKTKAKFYQKRRESLNENCKDRTNDTSFRITLSKRNEMGKRKRWMGIQRDK